MSMSNMPTATETINPANAGDIFSHEELLDLAAHDLQAPMRKAAVLTERIVTKFINDDADGREYARRLQACIHDMQAMVNSILEIGNLPPGLMQITSCNLDTILAKQVSLKEADNAVYVLQELGSVEGDARLLAILFEKLLDNAIKFSKENEPAQIEVSGRDPGEAEIVNQLLDTNRNYRVVEFSDKGIGFNETDGRKIFQPLVRLNGKSAYPGNGLGLVMCQKIVQAHKGIIYAEGIPGEGSRFTIILPQKQTQ